MNTSENRTRPRLSFTSWQGNIRSSTSPPFQNLRFGSATDRTKHHSGTNFFSTLQSIGFGDAEAETAGSIQQKLIKTNQQIGISDLLIGATAKAHNLKVATLNRKHFARIEGLVLVEREAS
ncbi:MAG: type II toxin-antitoxin system VapC family toxin [Saprospiraceae bacterium]